MYPDLNSDEFSTQQQMPDPSGRRSPNGPESGTNSQQTAYEIPYVNSDYIRDWIFHRFPSLQQWQQMYGRNGQQGRNAPEPIWPQSLGDFNLERFITNCINAAMFYIVPLLVSIVLNALNFIFVRFSGFLYRSLLYIGWLVLRYTILAPILTPYYTIKSYYKRADLIWRTSQSVWAFLQRIWYFWTGNRASDQRMRTQVNSEIQREVDEAESRLREQEEWMDREGRNGNRERPPRNVQEVDLGYYFIWIFIFSVVWLCYRYVWPAFIFNWITKLFGH